GGVETFGLAYPELKELVRNSIEYSFLPGASQWGESARVMAASPRPAGAVRSAPRRRRKPAPRSSREARRRSSNGSSRRGSLPSKRPTDPDRAAAACCLSRVLVERKYWSLPAAWADRT